MQYVRFDLIVYHANLEKLKKFTKLKKLVLSNNYLNSFILLSKIEVSIHIVNLLVSPILAKPDNRGGRGAAEQNAQELRGLQVPAHLGLQRSDH
jgi:hypothetical protein